MDDRIFEIEQDIYLEPEGNIIKQAKEIAEESRDAPKYNFCITYDFVNSEVVLSEVKRLECEILEQLSFKNTVTVKASFAQIKAIKSLNYIERVDKIE